MALAEMLTASRRADEAKAAIDRALRSAPPRADFYLRATAFLVQNDQALDALRFLDYGARLLPGNREILLLKACTLELVRRTEDAGRLLNDIQSRWPEWYPAWVAHGIVLSAHSHPEDARRAIETAAALGAPADSLKLDLTGVLDGALFR